MEGLSSRQQDISNRHTKETASCTFKLYRNNGHSFSTFDVLSPRRDGLNHWRNEGNWPSCCHLSGGVRGRFDLDTGVVVSVYPSSGTPYSFRRVQRDRSNQETLKAVEALGRKATIYTADLSSQAEVAALTPTILADGHKISILVNCAGIQRRHPSAQFPDNDWNEVGPIFAARRVMRWEDGAHG
jgi:hypothetical protein